MVEALSSETPVILFVDDDPDVLTSAQVLLARNGMRMLTARSPGEAWSVLAAEPVDVILLDLNFARGATSGAEGFEWLGEIRAHDAQAVVVVVTGHSGINIAVAAMKGGASDFVMKPWSNARFVETVRAAVALRRRRTGGADTPARDDDLLIVGDSAPMKQVREVISRVAASRAAVLAHGAAGTGKSLVARVLHARSGRAGSFVRLDVRSLAADAHDAFTRALEDAVGGTLFLDEVADLPAAAQARLLALLDAGPDVRLISSTRRRDALNALRDDLLARLDTVELFLPGLAQRGGDLELLAEHFVRLFARRDGRSPKPLDSSATDMLRFQPPAGEVRGLRQAAERAVALSLGDILTAADFTAPAAAAVSGGADLNLARSERAIVEAALRRHGHNVSHAARELGLTRAALYRRMVKHGL
jgi:DNA-binding NtrC family response regulator